MANGRKRASDAANGRPGESREEFQLGDYRNHVGRGLRTNAQQILAHADGGVGGLHDDSGSGEYGQVTRGRIALTDYRWIDNCYRYACYDAGHCEPWCRATCMEPFGSGCITRCASKFFQHYSLAAGTEKGHADGLVLLGRLDQQHDLRLRSYLHEDFGPLPTPTNLRPKIQNPHGSPNCLRRFFGEQRCHLSHDLASMPADGLPVGACLLEPLRPGHVKRRKVPGIYHGHLHNRRSHDRHGLGHCKTPPNRTRRYDSNPQPSGSSRCRWSQPLRSTACRR